VESAVQQNLGEAHPPHHGGRPVVAGVGEGDPAVHIGEHAFGKQVRDTPARHRHPLAVLLDAAPEVDQDGLDLHGPGPTLRSQAPVLQPDLAAGPGRNGWVVSHQGQCVPALVQVGEQGHDHGLVDRVQIARGLVGQDQRGLVDQRPRDAYALLLAAGELAWQVAHPLPEADPAQRLLRFTPIGHAVDVLREHDVFQRR
jgi:hypothetical protein